MSKDFSALYTTKLGINKLKDVILLKGRCTNIFEYHEVSRVRLSRRTQQLSKQQFRYIFGSQLFSWVVQSIRWIKERTWRRYKLCGDSSGNVASSPASAAPPNTQEVHILYFPTQTCVLTKEYFKKPQQWSRYSFRVFLQFVDWCLKNRGSSIIINCPALTR